MAPEYTAAQRAAFSFTALAMGDPQWRTLNWRRLSFTDMEWSPLCQLYGSVSAGLRRLAILPGDVAGLGFAALNPQDAEELRLAWRIYAPSGDNPGPRLPSLAVKAGAPVPPFHAADAFRQESRF